jgi:divalent metal cation (Fe/Co/Zn/Cd) transporter
MMNIARNKTTQIIAGSIMAVGLFLVSTIGNNWLMVLAAWAVSAFIIGVFFNLVSAVDALIRRVYTVKQGGADPAPKAHPSGMILH